MTIGHRGVLDPRPAPAPRPAATSAEQPRRRRGPGSASTTASACRPRRRAVEPTTRFQPPSAARARSRTVAPVRTSSPARAATAPGSRPMPPTQAGEHRGVGGRRWRGAPRPASASGPGRAARRPAAPRPARRSRGRARRTRRRAAAPRAGRRPRCRSRSSTSQPTLTSWPSRRVAGSPRSRRARARPEAEMTPLSASARRRAGTPISVRGIGRSRPRDQRFAVVVARVHDPVAQTASRASAHGLRTAVEHRLGADVDRDAAHLGAGASLPPIAGWPPGPRPRPRAPYDGPRLRPPARRCRRRRRPRAARPAEVAGSHVTDWQRPGHGRHRGGTGPPWVASQWHATGLPPRPAGNGAGHGQQDSQAPMAAGALLAPGRSHRLQRRRAAARRTRPCRAGGDAPEPGSRHPRLGQRGEKAPPGANRTVVTPKAIIRTGEVSLTAKDLAKVRDDVDALMAAVGGSIGTSRRSHDRKGRLESRRWCCGSRSRGSRPPRGR